MLAMPLRRYDGQSHPASLDDTRARPTLPLEQNVQTSVTILYQLIVKEAMALIDTMR